LLLMSQPIDAKVAMSSRIIRFVRTVTSTFL
jgi:hypothetical protein